MKKLLLLILLSFVSLEVLAQKAYLNTDYELNQKHIKIMVLPLLQANRAYTTLLLNCLSKAKSASVKLANIKTAIPNMLHDTLTNNSLNKILEKEYTHKEFKNNPNLSSLIGTQTTGYLKKMLDNADILLIPSNIKYRVVKKINGKGNTTMYGRFKLYDLNTGELIFDLHIKNKVNVIVNHDNVAEKVKLILKPFYDYYYKNFIVRNKLE